MQLPGEEKSGAMGGKAFCGSGRAAVLQCPRVNVLLTRVANPGLGLGVADQMGDAADHILHRHGRSGRQQRLCRVHDSKHKLSQCSNNNNHRYAQKC